MRLRTVAALLAGGLAMVACPGHAQPAARSGTGPQPFTLPPVESDAGRGDPGVLPPGVSQVVLSRILVQGNRAIATSAFAPITAAYLARPVDAADLEELRQRITRLYVERGFVNSGALIRAGALRGDTLTIHVVEGRLAAVRTRGLGDLREGYVLERLGIAPDAVLNVEELRERFALLLEDPLFAQATARLAPGEQLGEAWLDVDVVRARPYRWSVSVNNHRPPSVGSTAYGAAGVLRNLTGWGDRLEASYADPLGSGGRGGRGNLAFSLPVPGTRLELTAQHDEGSSSVVEGSLEPLHIRSRLRSDEIGVRWVALETLQHKLSAGVTRSWRRNTTTLLGEPFSFSPYEPDGVSAVAAWRVWQQASLRSAQQLIALRSTFTAARNNLRDVPGLPPEAGVLPPRAYTYWQGQAQFLRKLTDDGVQLVLRTAVQASSKPLVALDRFSIGGASTVRGFRENTLVRDRGGVANVELEVPLAMSALPGVELTLVPFLDYGRGGNVGAAAETLSSAGLAGRLRWKGLSGELAFGRRLARPPSSIAALGPRTLQDRGIHFQFSYSPP